MDVNYLADRGAYSGSASYYGTYDQGGNLWEWNEVVIERAVDDYVRGLRGGSWDSGSPVREGAEPDPPVRGYSTTVVTL